MAIAQEIVDRYVEHRAWMVRYEDATVREVLRILQRGEEQALGAISKAYSELLEESGGMPVTWSGKGVATRKKALRRVRAALDDVFPEAGESLKEALTEVARSSHDLFAESLADAIPDAVIDELELSRVPERQIANMVSDSFGDRFKDEAGEWFGSVGDTFGSLKDDTLKRVNRIMVDGVRDGTGTRNLISRARASLGVRKGDPLFNDVARYVRTAVQTTANDVAGQLHAENQDILRGEQFVATLDSDTCPECGPLDGKVFRFDGKGTGTIRRPPLHPNCRCFTAPVLKDWRAMGLPDTLPKSTKRLLDGKPAARTTWSEWVEHNPQRLDKALGPKRAKLVREGKVKTADLYDRKKDRLIPLTKLPDDDDGLVSIGKVLL